MRRDFLLASPGSSIAEQLHDATEAEDADGATQIVQSRKARIGPRSLVELFVENPGPPVCGKIPLRS